MPKYDLNAYLNRTFSGVTQKQKPEDVSEVSTASPESHIDSFIAKYPDRDSEVLKEGYNEIRDRLVAKDGIKYGEPITVDKLEQYGKERIQKNAPGLINEAGRSFARGVVGIPQTVGKAMQWLDPDGGSNVVENAGKSVEQFGNNLQEKLKPSIGMSKAAQVSPWYSARHMLAQGPESVVGSTLPWIAGAAAAPVAGTAGAMAAGLGTLGALFYAAPAEDKYRQAKQNGLSDEDAKTLANWEGGIEAGGELIADLIPMHLFGLAAKPVQNGIIKSLTSGIGPKEALKKIGTTILSETATEAGQAAAQTAISNKMGVDTGSVSGNVLDVIGPTIFMSLLFGGGGLAVNIKNRKGIINTLSDPESDIQTFSSAVNQVSEAAKDIDPNLADSFAKMAYKARQAGEPVIIADDSLYRSAQDAQSFVSQWAKDGQIDGVPFTPEAAGIFIRSRLDSGDIEESDLMDIADSSPALKPVINKLTADLVVEKFNAEEAAYNEVFDKEFQARGQLKATEGQRRQANEDFIKQAQADPLYKAREANDYMMEGIESQGTPYNEGQQTIDDQIKEFLSKKQLGNYAKDILRQQELGEKFQKEHAVKNKQAETEKSRSDILSVLRQAVQKKGEVQTAQKRAEYNQKLENLVGTINQRASLIDVLKQATDKQEADRTALENSQYERKSKRLTETINQRSALIDVLKKAAEIESQSTEDRGKNPEESIVKNIESKKQAQSDSAGRLGNTTATLIMDKVDIAGQQPYTENVEPLSQKTETTPEANKDDIDFELARKAYTNSYSDPDRIANDIQNSYVKHMNDFKEKLFTNIKEEDIPAAHEEFQKYKDGYIKRISEKLNAESKTASPMITGPAKFPIEKNRKAINLANKKNIELTGWAESNQNKILKKFYSQKNKLQTPESIQSRIDTLGIDQKKMKDANKILRNKRLSEADKRTSIAALGFNQEEVTNLFTPDYAGRTGFKDFEMSGNSAEIRRLKQKLNDINQQNSDKDLQLSTTNNISESKDTLKPYSIQDYFKKKNQQSGVNEDGSIWVRLNNGTGFNVQTVKRMSDTEYQIALSSGKMEKDGQIAGQITKNNIKLATDFASMQTLDHELVHLMENTGVITPDDMAVIDRRIKRAAANNKFKISDDHAENRAEYIAKLLKDRNIERETIIGRIVQRIKDFFDSLVHIGRQSTGNIAKGIESGKIFEKPGKMGTGNSQYSILTPNEAERNDPLSIPENSTLTDRFKEAIINYLAPVEKLQKALGGVSEDADVLTRETLRTSKAKNDIDEGRIKYLDPIKKLMADNNFKVEDADEYLYSRHVHFDGANERLRYTTAKSWLLDLDELRGNNALRKAIKDIDAALELDPYMNPKEAYYQVLKYELDNIDPANEKEVKFKQAWEAFAEKPTGMTDEEAAKLQEKWTGNEAMKEIGDLFDAMNSEKLDISVKAGRMTPDERAAMKATFKHYAPLKREGFSTSGSFGMGLKNFGKDAMARGGSTKRAVDILANAVTDYERTIVKAHKAETARAFKNLVESLPENSNFIRLIKPPERAEYDDSGNIRYVIDRNLDSETQVAFKVDGTQYIAEANRNNEYAKKIIGIIQDNPVKSGALINGLNKLNRVLATVNTSLSPEFMITNSMRDIQTAAINLSDTEVKDLTGKIIKDVPKAVKGLYSYIRGDMSHEWVKAVRLYKRSGAPVGWMDNVGNIEQRVKKLADEIDLERPARDLPAKKRELVMTKRTVKKFFDTIMDYNEIIENSVRLSSFKHAIDSGMSTDKAAKLARELTVNFNQKGTAGALVNSLWLFSNAGIQGSAKIISVLAKSKRARQIVGAATVLAAGLSMFNRAAGGDDEDGVSFYDKMDDFVKERNIILMIPGSKGKYAKLPLPWGYNVFWTIGDEIGKALYNPGDYKFFEGGSRLLNTTMNAFNPLQSATLAQTLSPTVFDPFVQVAENKTWSGSPLMPEGNQFSKYPQPDSQRYFKSARSASVFIAQLANELTLGNEVKPGAIDISPETLDLVFDTFTGSTGAFLANITDIPAKMAQGEDINVKDVPFVRKVIGSKSEYVDNQIFKKNSEYIYQLHAQAEKYPDKAREFKRDKAFGLMETLKTYEKRIRRLSKNAATSDREAKKKIDDRITTLKIKFNALYEKRKR